MTGPSGPTETLIRGFVSVASHLSNGTLDGGTDALTLNLVVLSSGVLLKTGTPLEDWAGVTEENDKITKAPRTIHRVNRRVFLMGQFLSFLAANCKDLGPNVSDGRTLRNVEGDIEASPDKRRFRRMRRCSLPRIFRYHGANTLRTKQVMARHRFLSRLVGLPLRAQDRTQSTRYRPCVPGATRAVTGFVGAETLFRPALFLKCHHHAVVGVFH